MFGSRLINVAYLAKNACLVMRDTLPLIVLPVSEFTTSTCLPPTTQLMPKLGALIWLRVSADVTSANFGLLRMYGGGRPWMTVSMRPQTALEGGRPFV